MWYNELHSFKEDMKMSNVDGSIISALEKLDPDEAAALEAELYDDEVTEEEEHDQKEYVFEFSE